MHLKTNLLVCHRQSETQKIWSLKTYQAEQHIGYQESPTGIVSPCHPFTHRVHVATERVLTGAMHYMHENLTATCTICILVVSSLTDCCPVSNPVENLQTFFVLARTESLSSPARCTQLFRHHMSLKSKRDTLVDMPSLMSKLVHQGTSWNI